MGIQIYPTVPVAQEAAEPWPVDEHTIRTDEMFARRLDTEFSTGVRTLLHDPETGLSSLKGEAALEAIAGAFPVLEELKQRTLGQAIGPRQKALLEPLIDTRLDWATGTIGRLAERATVEVDDQSVAERLAGLQQDAAAAWHDPAWLQKLGRTAVSELRWQGERRGWDAAETETRARAGLSDLYAGAVETAIRRGDLEGASGLYDHAGEVIAPERQAAIDRRFVRAREDAFLREVDAALSTLPLDPAAPPGLDAFAARTAELTPAGVTDEVRAQLGRVTTDAQCRAERQWHKVQAAAGVMALDWLKQNPEASLLKLSPEVRDWLAPDQWRGLETLLIDGRLRTDADLFERLDRQMVYEPEVFVGVDLDRHRLSLDDRDHARFAGAQKAIVDGTTDPAFARYDRVRRGVDRAFVNEGIDAGSADTWERFDDFEATRDRAPNVRDNQEVADDGAENTENTGYIAESEIDRSPPISADAQSEPAQEAADGEERPNEIASPGVNAVGDGSAAIPGDYTGDPNIVLAGGGARPSPRRGGGRPLTTLEETRAASFRSTLDAIRQLEPNNRELSPRITTRDWVPSDRDVARVQEELLRAKARAAGETSAIPIGSHARDSLPARGPERDFSAEERREVDRIGNQHGCHACGTMTPGSSLGHWVPDHQPPSALSRPGATQRLYPQCLSCSYQQGGEVTQQRRQGGGQR